MSERIPPHHLPSEKAVLASLLLDNSAIVGTMEVLGVDDFYSSSHRSIYEAITRLYESGEPVDLVTLPQKMSEAGTLAKAGGQEYILDLFDSGYSSANLSHYVGVIKDKARLRRVLSYTATLRDRAYSPEASGVELEEQFQRAAFLLEATKPKSRGLEPISAVLTSTLKNINKTKESIIPTGLLNLDRIITGFELGDLCFIGARPSMGKTALALGILLNATRYTTCAFFSLEMSATQIGARILSSKGRVNLHHIRCGTCSNFDIERLQTASAAIEKIPLYIDDTGMQTVSQIKSRVMSLSVRIGKDIGFVVIDYLQLMKAEGKFTSDNAAVSSITKGLKQIAKDLKTRVICLSQLSREIDRRPATDKNGVHLRKPTDKDFRDSGSIEQDADILLGIYRPERYQEFETKPELKGTGQIIVIKNRNGPIGLADVRWNQETATFLDAAPINMTEET
jgi:replicative DNA helicase